MAKTPLEDVTMRLARQARDHEALAEEGTRDPKERAALLWMASGIRVAVRLLLEEIESQRVQKAS